MKKTYKKKYQQSYVGEIEIDQKKYPVAYTAYEVADGTIRFRVSVNKGPVHIFGLNKDLSNYDVVDGSSIDPLTRTYIQAIDQMLQNKKAA